MSEARIVIGADGQQAINELARLKSAFSTSMTAIETSVSSAKSALAAMGVTLSGAYFVGLIKGSIDAADRLKDLSKSTNLSVEDLAGLKLLAKQTGTDLDGLAKGINKMSVEMGKDPDKFKKLGITATDSKEALKQFADIFNLLPDINQRNALAQKVFSKSWAELAPALSEGGKSIGETIEKGARLSGITKQMTDDSDAFNDKWAELTSTGGLLTRQVAPLMPLLNSLADDMISAQNSTQGLDGAFSPLAETFRAVIILGGNVGFVMKTAGTEIGGLAAQLAALMSGDFSGAARIGEMMKEDAVKGRAAFDAWEKKILTTTQATSGLGNATDALSRKMSASAAAAKAVAAAAAAKAARDFLNADKLTKEKENEFAKINKQIQEKIDLDTQSIALGRELTEAEKFNIKIINDMNEAKVGLTLTERSLIETKLKGQQVLAKEAAWQKQANEENKKYYEALDQITKSLRDEVKAQQEATDKAGLQAKELQYLEQAKIKNLVADKLMRASVADVIDITGQEGDVLREQVRLLQKNGDLKASAFDKTIAASMRDALKDLSAETASLSMTNAQREIAIKLREAERLGLDKASAAYSEYAAQITAAVVKKDAIDEGIKQQVGMWQTIEGAAKDTFLSIFDSGKSAFTRLKDTLKNGLYAMLYEMTVKKWLINIVASTSGASVAQQALGATGNGGGVLGMLSNLSSLNTLTTAISTGVAGAVGSSVGAIFGTVAGNTATGVALGLGTGSSLAAASAASVAGGGAAAGAGLTSVAGGLAAIGPVGWAALAVGAVASIFSEDIFGGKRTNGTAGIEGSFSGSRFSGNRFQNYTEDGGWFGSDSTGRDMSGLDAATAQKFSQSYAAIQSASTQAAKSLGLSADAVASYSERISVQITGDAAADEKAINSLFANLSDNVASAAAPGMLLLKKEGETSSAALARLSTSLSSVNALFTVMGTRLFGVGLSGADAASRLVDAFGGLEQLASATQAYYSSYYTEAERAQRITDNLTAAFAGLNLAAPKTKDEFRSLVSGLDLNTEAGRAAYAALLKLAPEFANSAELATRFAKETAGKLLATFTAGGRLMPALSIAAAQAGLASSAMAATGGSLGYISRLFLNVNSGLIKFGGGVTPLASSLTSAQLASARLSDEIDEIQRASKAATYDMADLSAALATVDTSVFVNVMDGVLASLAERFKDTLGAVAGERVAVRSAILQMLDPTALSRDAIARGISSVSAGSAPGNAALLQAQSGLTAADNLVAQRKAALESVRASGPDQTALDAARAGLGNAKNATAAAQALVDQYRGYGNSNFNAFMDQAFAGNDLRGSVPNPSGERNAQNTVFNLRDAQRNEQPALAAYEAALGAYGNAAALSATQVAQAQARLSDATSVQAAAVSVARVAQLAYITSLQDFSIDASKSVSRLTKLREETVKYYDAQKQLASLMGSSASGIRSTAAAYKFDQLGAAAQFDDLQSRFASAYAMALSTDGEALASYGDKLNGLLNPLLAKAQDALSGTQLDSFIATTLARADNIAGRIEALTPTNYAADSIALLGQIDGTLAAIDASGRSAEKIIADAVNAGSDKTAQGLRAVIAALTGQTIPAFASGGAYQGGFALVGESGPEVINFDRGGQVYTAQQTAGMFAGRADNTAVVSELRAVRNELENLRAEARATALSNAAMQTMAERTYYDGQLVITAADQPLKTTT